MTRSATSRSAIHDRVYVDTLALRDPQVVARFMAAVVLAVALLWVTASWAGSPGSLLGAAAESAASVGAQPALDR